MRLFDPSNLSLAKSTAAGPATLAEFFERSYQPLKLATCKPATIIKYRDTIAHVQRALGPRPLSLLPPNVGAIVLRYLRSCRGRYGRMMADHTIRGHLVRLKSLLHVAYRKGALAQLPEIPTIAIESELAKKFLSRGEFDRMLSVTGRMRTPRGLWRVSPSLWWHCALSVVWWTACRKREMLTLTFDDLIEPDVLRIRPLFKRAKKPRYVVLDNTTARCIEQMRPHGRYEIFPQAPHANLTRSLRRLAKLAGVTLPPANAWHSLRRGRCEEEYQRGGLAYAQARLGHASSATTEQAYLSAEVKKHEEIRQQRLLLEQLQS